MRIPSGSTDKYVYFLAVDATDLQTPETGLSSFTVVRSRNGAADATFTTPTITEIDSVTMPGIYALLLDEDTTLTTGALEEEMVLCITHAGMMPRKFSVTIVEGVNVSQINNVQLAGDGVGTPMGAA